MGYCKMKTLDELLCVILPGFCFGQGQRRSGFDNFGIRLDHEQGTFPNEIREKNAINHVKNDAHGYSDKL